MSGLQSELKPTLHLILALYLTRHLSLILELSLSVIILLFHSAWGFVSSIALLCVLQVDTYGL